MARLTIDMSIWEERGRMAARGNADARRRGEPLADVVPGSAEERALLESWLRESRRWQEDLNAMGAEDRANADAAAWRGYCAERATS